jgi:hypothetical protein
VPVGACGCLRAPPPPVFGRSDIEQVHGPSDRTNRTRRHRRGMDVQAQPGAACGFGPRAHVTVRDCDPDLTWGPDGSLSGTALTVLVMPVEAETPLGLAPQGAAAATRRLSTGRSQVARRADAASCRFKGTGPTSLISPNFPLVIGGSAPK